jgi:META domain
MRRMSRRAIGLFVIAVLAGSMAPAFASNASFPFGMPLVLDAAPIPGSKRLPVIEIDENGSASIYLWCASVRGSASVGDATITIVPTTPLPSQCTKEQISRDAGLLAQLAQVTGWRRQGDAIELLGAATLRFRLMTN